jgi:hypothetical protein
LGHVTDVGLLFNLHRFNQPNKPVIFESICKNIGLKSIEFLIDYVVEDNQDVFHPPPHPQKKVGRFFSVPTTWQVGDLISPPNNFIIDVFDIDGSVGGVCDSRNKSAI